VATLSTIVALAATPCTFLLLTHDCDGELWRRREGLTATAFALAVLAVAVKLVMI
jgi:hypothetical protein